jgi:hypothetical protein
MRREVGTWPARPKSFCFLESVLKRRQRVAFSRLSSLAIHPSLCILVGNHNKQQQQTTTTTTTTTTTATFDIQRVSQVN